MSQNESDDPVKIGLNDLPNIGGGASGPPGPSGSGITGGHMINIKDVDNLIVLRASSVRVNRKLGKSNVLNFFLPKWVLSLLFNVANSILVQNFVNMALYIKSLLILL